MNEEYINEEYIINLLSTIPKNILIQCAKIMIICQMLDVIKKIAPVKKNPINDSYHILCSLQLSPLTKDEKTREAMEALQKYGLTVKNIASIDLDTLEELIRPVGLYHKKAIYMKDTANILIDKYNGAVPANLTALLSLPGIGQKIAHLVLQEAFGIVSGISVDTHIYRMSNKLGWTNATNALKVQKDLEALIPKSKWSIVNNEMFKLGKMIQQRKFIDLSNLNHKEYNIALEILEKLSS